MTGLLYLEIDLIGIAIIAILFFGRKHSAVQAQDQVIFDYLLIFSAFVILLDGVTWYLDGKPGDIVYIFISFVAVTYNIFVPVLGFIWLLYCRYKVNNDITVVKRKFILYFLPIALNLSLSIYSLYDGVIFSISDENVYMRGSMFYINVIINLGYLFYSTLICLIHAIKEGNLIKKNELYTMAAFILPPMLGGIIQVSFYGLSLIWVCLSISLLLMYMNIQAHMISIDTLTGINNRWQLTRYLETKTKNISEDKALFVFMIDVDEFKSINDKYGHAVGDEALINTANVLKKYCGQTHNFLARLGGDEFVIVAEADSIEDAELMRDELMSMVCEYNKDSDNVYDINLSIGFSGIHEQDHFESVSKLLAEADKNMYSIKQTHHNKSY